MSVDDVTGLGRVSGDRQKNIDDKTSFGQYLLKTVKVYGVLIAGGVAGGLAFWSLGKNEKAVSKITEIFKSFTKDDVTPKAVKGILPVIGIGIGTILSQIVNAYSGWKRVESETLQVEEVNKDVGTLMEERQKFATTLTRQEQYIQRLIAARQNGTPEVADAQAQTAER